jgi:hypothetical protein
MNRLVSVAVLIVISVAGQLVAQAACRVQTRTVAANVVAVPLAVTVGVPVAQVAPYYYSYQATAGSAVSDSSDAVIAAKVVSKLRQGAAPAALSESSPSAARAPSATPAPPQATLVSQKCAICHSGSAPKANLSLENISRLDCVARLKAVRAVLTEKMPKGGPRLTPEEAGKILEELTQASDP